MLLFCLKLLRGALLLVVKLDFQGPQAPPGWCPGLSWCPSPLLPASWPRWPSSRSLEHILFLSSSKAFGCVILIAFLVNSFSSSSSLSSVRDNAVSLMLSPVPCLW